MQKTVHLILGMLVLSTLYCSCSKEKKEMEIKNLPVDQQNTYAYFAANLHSGMDYATIVDAFGKPVRDIGSGIHIYVYELDDETEVWIGYTDRMIYARHLDKQLQLLHELVNSMPGSEG